jgi:hypothetical protein
MTVWSCGAKAIDTSAGGVIVREAVALIEPEDAVIVDVPTVKAVAIPEEEIEATLADDDAQATLLKVCLDVSVKVPVATNCCWVPLGIETVLGETAIETSAGAITVRVLIALIGPEDAVITEDPCAKVFAKPAAEIVATPVLAEVQKQELVMSLVVRSL